LQQDTRSGKVNLKYQSFIDFSYEPPPPKKISTLVEAMRMVKECGVKEKIALMHTATLLTVKPEIREIPSLLETNEGRLEGSMQRKICLEPLCLDNYVVLCIRTILLDNYSLLNYYVACYINYTYISMTH
jgi:hypothetical protein